MRKYLILLLIPFIMGAGVPASRHWTPVFFGGAGAFMTVFPDIEDSNKVYALSDVAAFFKSTDGAETWELSNTNITSVTNEILAQSPVQPDIMYILGASLNKSTNRGKTWAQTGTNLSVNINTRSVKVIAFDPNNVDTVYIGLTNGQIKKTTDGGATFTTYATPFGTNVPIHFLAINRAGTYMYAGSNSSGMVRYTLADATATTITLTGTNALYNQDYSFYMKNGTEYFCVSGGLHIACSTDNGSSWTNMADVTGDTSFFIYRFATRILSTNEVRVVAYGRRISTPYGENVAVVSSDSGTTWTNIWSNITEDNYNPPGNAYSFDVLGNVYYISSDPNSETTFYISTDGAVLKSTDGGINWVQKNVGLQNTVVNDIAVSPGGDYIFACGMDMGLVRSTDNGAHWTPMMPHGPNADPQGFAVAGHYWRVVTMGTEAEWDAGHGVVVATSSWWVDFIPRVVRSTDNGATWTVITSGLPTTQLSSSGTKNTAAWGIGYPRGLTVGGDGNTLYMSVDGYSATENGGIFKSTNRGLTWTRTTQPTGWKVYHGLAADPSDPTGNTVSFAEWFYTNPDLPHGYKSTNGGITWVDTGVVSYGVFGMTYSSTGTAYRSGLLVGGFPGVEYSVNGNTWIYMHALNTTDNIGHGIAVDPNDENRLFAGVYDGTSTGPLTSTRSVGGSIYMTDNALAGANATWTNLTGDLQCYSGVTSIKVNPYEGTDGYLYIATAACGVFKLNLSPTVSTTLQGVSFQ